MSDNSIVKAVAGTCISFSWILAGNAVTQSFMTIPALLVDFPSPGTEGHADRARLFGRQWPLCWQVGNVFFRPISTLSFIGYTYTAYSLYKEGSQARGDWRMFAVAAAAALTTIVHSAVNMQPLNDKLEALAEKASEKDLLKAEPIARQWAKWNLLRVVMPVLSGSLALWQSA